MSNEQAPIVDPRDKTIREQVEKIRQQAQTIEQQVKVIEQQADKLVQLRDNVKRLETLVEGKADAKASKKPIFTQNYSLGRNKHPKRSKKNSKRKRAGLKPTRAKRGLATAVVDIHADGVACDECIRHRSQYAWRLVEGKAVYVSYAEFLDTLCSTTCSSWSHTRKWNRPTISANPTLCTSTTLIRGNYHAAARK